jgi:hypothetical protein
MVLGLGYSLPRLWKEGQAATGNSTTSRKQPRLEDPTAVSFLFDTAFFWISEYGSQPKRGGAGDTGNPKECLER